MERVRRVMLVLCRLFGALHGEMEPFFGVLGCRAASPAVEGTARPCHRGHLQRDPGWDAARSFPGHWGIGGTPSELCFGAETHFSPSPQQHQEPQTPRCLSLGWAQLPKNLRGASKHPQTPQPHYGNKDSCTTPPTPLHGAAPGPQHPAAPPATQRHQPPGTARAQPSPGAPKLPHASPGPASPACFPRSPVGFRILFAQLCSRPGPLRGRLENGVALKRVSQPSSSHRDASSHAAIAPGGHGAGCSGGGFYPFSLAGGLG